MFTAREIAEKLGSTPAEISSAKGIISAIQREFQASPARAVALLKGVDAAHADGRTKSYAFRLFVFDDRAEIVADTDPHLEGDAIGEMRTQGLNDLARDCADMILSLPDFARLDPAELRSAFESRIPTLRVALTRAQGYYASWRIPFMLGSRAHLARVVVMPER